MKLGICEYGFLPMRSNMSHKSEMVNQVLFGEIFEIIIKKSEWTQIRLLHDDYIGWIETQTISNYEIENTDNNYIEKSYVVNERLMSLVKNNSEQIFIPQGSVLPASIFADKNFKIGNNDYYVINDIAQSEHNDIRTEIKKNALEMINTPYLWGGRSQWGIDCSGFAQLICRLSGKLIPRDASQQSKIGNTLNFVSEAQAGDFAFFDSNDGKIVHVGMFLSQETIIHASKRVRIDKIDHHGIYNSEIKGYTHKLRIIKDILSC